MLQLKSERLPPPDENKQSELTNKLYNDLGKKLLNLIVDIMLTLFWLGYFALILTGEGGVHPIHFCGWDIFNISASRIDEVDEIYLIFQYLG